MASTANIVSALRKESLTSRQRTVWFYWWIWAVSLLPFLAGAGEQPAANESDLVPRGELSIHDPSTIVSCNGEYWVFGTGRGIVSRHSPDLVTWEAGPRVFTNLPAWTTNAVPGFKGHIWAPDVIQVGNEYRLYYSISTWGSRTSAIGLVTNRTLNPADPGYAWRDQGVVIQSNPEESYNAIDPCVACEAGGRMWLGFGSFWSGIKLVELDRTTGKCTNTNTAVVAVAWKEAIEAAYLYPHGDYYYLFVNWGQCCRGVQSTYEIRVGRSRSLAGPYVDKAGVNLLAGGGSPFLGSEGRFIGPGHAAVLQAQAREWLSFHYYDGQNRGAATLGLRRLTWDAEGWPQAIKVASQARK